MRDGLVALPSETFSGGLPEASCTSITSYFQLPSPLPGLLRVGRAGVDRDGWSHVGGSLALNGYIGIRAIGGRAGTTWRGSSVGMTPSLTITNKR